MQANQTVACPCGAECALKTGRDVYPHRADLSDKFLWVCPSCGARVGCHKGGTKPLGTPANAELRRARMLLHDQRLDPIWKYAEREKYGKRASRRAITYKYLAHLLGIPRNEAHTGLFTLEQCRAAWRALRGVTMDDVLKHHLTTKKAAHESGEDL